LANPLYHIAGEEKIISHKRKRAQIKNLKKKTSSFNHADHSFTI